MFTSIVYGIAIWWFISKIDGIHTEMRKANMNKDKDRR